MNALRFLPNTNARVWLALLWKEWRESRWKLASLTAIAVLTPMLLTVTDKGVRDAESVFVGAVMLTLCLYVPLASLFVASSTTSGEHATGTIDFFRGLPVRTSTLALVKLVVACFTVVTPMVLLIATLSLYKSETFDEPQLFLFMVFVVLSAFSLTIWITALGANSSSEIRAAAVALGVIVPPWAVWAAVTSIPRSTVMFLPGGTALLPNFFISQANLFAALPILFAIHATLVVWWLRRYGQAGAPKARSPKPAADAGRPWLPSPRSSPFAAIAWKQFRESGPVIAGTVAIAAAMTVALIVGEEVPGDARPLHYLWALSVMTVYFGFLAALVVGIGLFSEDLRPRTGEFWRSRPISPNAWFGIKYATGFLCLAATFGAAAMAFLVLGQFEEVIRPEAIDPTPWVVGFWMVYACAVGVGCLIRNAVYTSVLSFMLISGVLGVSGEYLYPSAWQSVLFAGVALVLTSVACLAVRNDWALFR